MNNVINLRDLNVSNLKDLAEAKITACDVCGTEHSIIKGNFDIAEGIKCTRSLCLDGTIKDISPLLLPTVTTLNAGGLKVTDSYIEVCPPSWVDIVINFRDVYGNQFKGSPVGFEFDLEPNPTKHYADTPIELKKRIEIRGKSDCGIFEEIQCSISELYTWAKACCKSHL